VEVDEARDRLNRPSAAAHTVAGPHDMAAESMAPFYPHKGERLTWQQSYENLQVYKQTYGDCDVPKEKYKHNVKLGRWVVRGSIIIIFGALMVLFCFAHTEQTTEKEKESRQVRQTE